MVILFLPKVVSVLTTLGRPEDLDRFASQRRLVMSALVETMISIVLAPINMALNSKFALFSLVGQGVSWVTQRRGSEGDGPDWREAIITHGGHTMFGMIWGACSYI